jgi:hypothetical protein
VEEEEAIFSKVIYLKPVPLTQTKWTTYAY